MCVPVFLMIWWQWMTVCVSALWNGRDGQEGRTSAHETGRWLSADGAWSFQWSFAASCLGPQIRFHPAAADSAHTAHSIFAPQRRSLHTHNTTPKQVPCRAAVKNKFENIFRQYFSWNQYRFTTIFESLAWCSRRICLVHTLHILCERTAVVGRWRGWGLGPCPGWLERKYKDECSLRNASLYVVTWSQAAFSPRKYDCCDKLWPNNAKTRAFKQSSRVWRAGDWKYTASLHTQQNLMLNHVFAFHTHSE